MMNGSGWTHRRPAAICIGVACPQSAIPGSYPPLVDLRGSRQGAGFVDTDLDDHEDWRLRELWMFSRDALAMVLGK